jgi:hypothetical protein
MQLIRGELSVRVLVELLECGRRIGDFFSGQFAVVIGVEHFHQRIAGRTVRPTAAPFSTALRRTLAVAVVVTSWRSFRRLGDDSGRSQRAQHTDDPERATHFLISSV